MSQYYEAMKNGYSISTNPFLINVDVVHNYLSNESYWAKNVPREIVEKSIANSISFGLYHNENQIGFARLITDKATFAYLADVFILEQYRGKGLSKWLMETIIAFPEINGVRGILLRTKDAHGLYQQFGWEQVSEESIKRYMIKSVQKEYPELAGD